MHGGWWKLIETPQHDVLGIPESKIGAVGKCSFDANGLSSLSCTWQSITLVLNASEVMAFPSRSFSSQTGKNISIHFFNTDVINIKFPLKLFTHSQKRREKHLKLSEGTFTKMTKRSREICNLKTCLKASHRFIIYPQSISRSFNGV